MEKFDDLFGDLSEYKILSFDEISKGFEGNKNPLQEITSKSFEEMSVFKNSPFGQYWEKNLSSWALVNYGSSRVFNEKNFMIIDFPKKFSSAIASYYNYLITENWDDIKFIVYANPNGSEVLKQYADTNFRPDNNQVLFFIETDDGKLDFGKIVRVKLGKEAIKKLQFQFPYLGETDEKELAEEFLKRPFDIKNNSSLEFIEAGKEVKLDTKELKNLLAKAIKYDFQQKKFDDMSWFLIFLQGGEYLGLNIPKKILEVSHWMRTKKYDEEKYWNAFLNRGFAPIFLPDIIVPGNRKEIVKFIKNKFKQQVDNVSKPDQNDVIIQKVFKEILNNLLLYLFEKLSSLLDEGLKKLDEVLPEGEILNELYSLNAFLVGLWNGCLEFVAGIIDLISLIMIIERDGIGFTLTDALNEALENLLNDLIFNFENFIKKLWIKVSIAFKEFPDWYLKYGSNPYYWYKNLGELIPDIIFILVPALKAGRGAKAIEEVSLLRRASTVAERDLIAEQQYQKYINSYYETLRSESDDFAKQLEEQSIKKESKEAFKKAETELEERIPKETKIEEIIIKDKVRKKVLISNIEDIGKLDDKVIFKLVDDTGKEIGELIRGIGTKGRSTTYKFKWNTGRRSFKLNSDVKLYDSKMARSANLPVNGTEQIIYGDLNIPVEITSQYSGFGELMLDDSLAYFKNNPKLGKVDGNIGFWVEYGEYYKDYGGKSINLKQFWEAVDTGKSYEKAAFETFTGKWAKKNGFTKVVFDPKREVWESEVVVKFLK